MKLKSIIVDDEIMARTSLQRLCSKREELDLLAVCENAEEALEKLKENEIDLIFLDIEMPGLSGLELLEQIDVMPQVIFTTSKKEYAYEAYEYEITDFLKKPILQPRFNKAVEKAVIRAEQLDAVALSSLANEIYVKTDGRYVRIPYNDILYFENVGDYVNVCSRFGNFIIHGALKSVDSRLSHPRLIKVHRSFIVNLDHIKDIEDNTLVIEKKVIPISRAYKPILMKSINIL